MRIYASQYETYADSLKSILQNRRISKITHFDNGVFAFALSNKESLVFIVSGKEPRVYVSPSSFAVPSLTSTLATQLRKNCGNGKILDVSPLNGDSILCLKLACIDELYQEKTYYLIAELIPFKANLILLDESKSILASIFTASLDSPRPLFRGLTYAPPQKNEAEQKEVPPFVYEDHLKGWLSLEGELRERRKKARFSNLFDYSKKKIKTLEKRLSAIEGDSLEAEKHCGDGEYGNFIFTNLDSIPAGSSSFDYYGETIPLDSTLSLSKNAERFFKRGKKAKAALSYAKKRYEQTEKELQEAKQFLRVLSACDEEDLERYEKEFHLSRKDEKNPLMDSAFLPFEIFYAGVRYVYGHNARQNDFLGTLFSKKGECLFLHVKLGHGSHLIIDKENPTDKEIEAGCCFVLLASHQEMGEVMIAKKKEVKKGPTIGQAIVKSYTSAFIRKIDEPLRKAFEEERKISL